MKEKKEAMERSIRRVSRWPKVTSGFQCKECSLMKSVATRKNNRRECFLINQIKRHEPSFYVAYTKIHMPQATS